jgi:haloalkane dehalogenase
MEHYRGVQARPEDRRGIAELPRQIVTAAPWLAELESTVPARLGDKPMPVAWPRRDVAFPAKRTLPRLRAAFRDVTVVELQQAKHFFLEDDRGDVAAAIRLPYAPVSSVS